MFVFIHIIVTVLYSILNADLAKPVRLHLNRYEFRSNWNNLFSLQLPGSLMTGRDRTF